VLYALKELFLKHDEDKFFTESEVETEARHLGRPVDPNTVWLGLYLAEYFNVLGGWRPNDDQTGKASVRVAEYILKLKQIDKVWEPYMQEQIHWLAQRDSYNRSTPVMQFEEGADIVSQTGPLVFISHSSKDADVALSLIELLRSGLGLRDDQIRCTSVDGFRLPSGVNTDDVLKAEVQQAEAFIGLITPNSLASAYVLFELGARWGARRHMVPVLAGLGPNALQGPLKGINSISAENIAQLHQLLSDLADTLRLERPRPAAYTRYAEKLIQNVQETYGTFPTAGRVKEPKREGSFEDPPPHGDERKLRTLTRDAVIAASKRLQWNKQLPKWTVLVDGASFPVRPLAFSAAGLLPNDPATTHQAVAVLKQLGFQVFYEGKPA